MPKVDRINYDESLVIRLIANIIQKNPGVDFEQEFSVHINDSHTAIDITVTPVASIYNIYSLAREIEDNVYFQLKKIFDLLDIVINVTVKGVKDDFTRG